MFFKEKKLYFYNIEQEQVAYRSQQSRHLTEIYLLAPHLPLPRQTSTFG